MTGMLRSPQAETAEGLPAETKPIPARTLFPPTSPAMSKSIHTIDSRENLELLTVAAFFGIQSDAMHSLISDWHDLLEAELQSEGIDYRELKAALVPAKKKREAALIFDTAAIPDAWYPLPVFEKLLQYLDRKSVNSVLMGDFIERSSPGVPSALSGRDRQPD